MLQGLVAVVLSGEEGQGIVEESPEESRFRRTPHPEGAPDFRLVLAIDGDGVMACRPPEKTPKNIPLIGAGTGVDHHVFPAELDFDGEGVRMAVARIAPEPERAAVEDQVIVVFLPAAARDGVAARGKYPVRRGRLPGPSHFFPLLAAGHPEDFLRLFHRKIGAIEAMGNGRQKIARSELDVVQRHGIAQKRDHSVRFRGKEGEVGHLREGLPPGGRHFEAPDLRDFDRLEEQLADQNVVVGGLLGADPIGINLFRKLLVQDLPAEAKPVIGLPEFGEEDPALHQHGRPGQEVIGADVELQVA